MHKLLVDIDSRHDKFVGAIFITFSGNCKEALTFYQTCFGGTLQFETLETTLHGMVASPVVSGSLVAEGMVIHGSDLVHNEGRILGNYMALFLKCTTSCARKELIAKLQSGKKGFTIGHDNDQLIEITDTFEVRWVLSI